MINQVLEILKSFQPISLKEIECVKLMTRTDEKYLCPVHQLNNLLNKAQADFQVLENLGKRLLGYESLYLDTSDHRMYLDHHNGKLNRYKIRIRDYKTTGESFLEIKKKDSHRNTAKTRIPLLTDRNYHTIEMHNFIAANTPYDPTSLEPQLTSSFSRITLVNNELLERVTLDIFPSWRNGQKTISAPNVVIIEVKSAKNSSTQGFGNLLREERILPKRLSKYCIGTALLYPEIKQNRFKAKLLYLKKLNKNLVYGAPVAEPI
jgi:hypothetical protein